MGIPTITRYDKMAITTTEIKEMKSAELVVFLENNFEIPPNQTEIFSNNAIDGKVLFSMTEGEMKTLGILFGHARRISQYIRQLLRKENDQESIQVEKLCRFSVISWTKIKLEKFSLQHSLDIYRDTINKNRTLVASIPVVDMDGEWDSYNIDSITIDIGAGSFIKTIFCYADSKKEICSNDICNHIPVGKTGKGYMFLEGGSLRIDVNCDGNHKTF